MAELSFVKSFLTSLDTKPVQVPVDYAVDLKTFEPSGPYTLPRMPKAMRKPEGSENVAAPGSAPALSIALKSAKNPQLDLRLTNQPFATSVLELKQRIATEVGLKTTDKIRLLYKKKPCADSKTVKEIVTSGAGDHGHTDVEFSVMVIGGASFRKEEESAMTDAPVVAGPGGEAMLSQEFWDDLRGFLQQRLKDAEVAKKAANLFESAWKNQPNP